MSEYQHSTADTYITSETVRPVRQAMPLRCAQTETIPNDGDYSSLRCEIPRQLGNVYIGADYQQNLVGGEEWYVDEADRLFKQTERYGSHKAELVRNLLRGFFVATEMKNFQYGIPEELRSIDDLDVRDELDRQVEAARDAMLSPKDLYKLGTYLSSIQSIELARLTTPNGGAGQSLETLVGTDFEKMSYKGSQEKIYPLADHMYDKDTNKASTEISSWIFEIRDTFDVHGQDMDVTQRRMYCVPESIIIDGKAKGDATRDWIRFVKKNNMQATLHEMQSYGLCDELRYCLAQVVYAHEPR